MAITKFAFFIAEFGVFNEQKENCVDGDCLQTLHFRTCWFRSCTRRTQKISVRERKLASGAAAE